MGQVSWCGPARGVANPVTPPEHIEDVRIAAERVISWGIRARVVGLYVNEYGTINVVSGSRSGSEEIRSYL